MKPTQRQPLFIISGASGVGKSTLCEHLFQHEVDYIVIDSDLLWNEAFNTPENNYRAFRQLWLNLAANISQIGKPVVLCGCNTPEQLENLEERALFTDIHYLALVCDEQMLRQRMTRGRGIADENWIASSVHFNEWLKQHASLTQPPMTLLDTTKGRNDEHADVVHEWIMSHF